MIRIPSRPLAVVALPLLLVIGVAACSGSEDQSGSTSTTSSGVTTPTTSGALGDLSDLDGSAAGLTGDALDCYNVQLAVSAAAAVPAASLDGSSSDADITDLRADITTLQSQLPSSVSADFQTYMAGVDAYAAAVADIDVSDITDPATQQALEAAGAELEAPDVQSALDRIQTFLHDTCPASGGS